MTPAFSGKRILILALSLLLVISLAGLISCGESEITGLSFTDKTVEYNGEAHTIELTGAPSGATVTYLPSNSFTDAGVYTVTATVKAEGYLDTTLTATLTVSPKQLTVEWGSLNFPANGKTPTPSYTLSGFIGEDESELSFDFGGCEFNKAGQSFTMTATPKNTNYTLGAEGTKSLKVGSSSATVSFETGVKNKTVEPQTVKIGRKAEDPGRPSRIGYTFGGWYLGDREWIFDEDKVEEDITLSAKWISNSYSVSYYLNGGVNSDKNPDTFLYSDGLKLHAPTREGYAFLGWYKDIGLTEAANGVAPEGLHTSLDLYASWSPLPVISAKEGTALIECDSIHGEIFYTLSVNIKSFAEGGAIIIGRGAEEIGGSYIKITENELISITNTEDGEIRSDSKTHTRDMIDLVTVKITVSSDNTANISLVSRDGESNFYGVYFMANKGNIFFKCENAETENVSIAYSLEAEKRPVWIIGDDIGGTDSWTSDLSLLGAEDYLSLNINNHSFDEALSALPEMLSENTPKYLVCSLSDSTVTETQLTELISLCKEFSVTPVLVKRSASALNSAIESSGERVIDLTAVGEDSLSAAAKALVDMPELITPSIPLKSAGAETLLSGEKLDLGNSRIKDSKYYVFSADLDGELSDGDVIFLEHGYMVSYGRWLEISKDKITVASYTSWSDPQIVRREFDHGLTIKNYICVILSTNYKGSGDSLTIVTDGGSVKLAAPGWTSCEGHVCVRGEGVTLGNARLTYTCKSYTSDIWIIGASYLSLRDSARWPEYYYAEGYQGAFLAGRGGMGAQHGIEDLKDALNYATPRILIWDSVSGNNADKSGAVDPVFLENTLEMLEICKEKGIKVYIQTMPNCPKQTNWYKNNALINRTDGFENYEYTVIDLARALGARDELNPSWYEGMLYTDLVHPTALGARASYLRIICDAPELILGRAAEVITEKAALLGDGGSISITPTDKLNEQVITLTAEMNGSLSGSITIGEGRGENGGCFVRIDKEYVTVFTVKDGEEKELIKEKHGVKISDILSVKLHIEGSRVRVALASSAEDEPTAKTLKVVESGWCVSSGELYTAVSGASLSEVVMKYCTAD